MAAVTFFQAFDSAWAQDGVVFGWSEEQYRQGWAVIGDTKPSVEQFNNVHQIIDQKANYLFRQLQTAASDRGVATDESKDDSLLELLNQQRDAILNAVYPVGAVYINASSSANPGAFLPGVWEKLDEGFLYPHGAQGAGNLGATGGSTTVTLTEAQMPRHDHNVSASSGSAGSHSHTGTAASAGAHTHSRGTMDITGTFWNLASTKGASRTDRMGSTSGAFGLANRSGDGVHTSDADPSSTTGDGIDFEASRTWSGSTSSAGTHSHSVSVGSAGSHTHSISVSESEAGSGQPHSNMPPYLTVFMWKRIS